MRNFEREENKRAPLLPLPNRIYNLPPHSGGSRDQTRPGFSSTTKENPG